MKAKIVLTAVAVVLVLCTGAYAIDRSAKMFDSLTVSSTSFNGGYSLGVKAKGENATAAASGKWSILASCAFGQQWLNDDDLGDPKFLELGLGLKHYLFPITSVAVMGSYTLNDWGRSPDAAAGTFELKQRFVPADEPVSPFLRGTVSMRNSSYSVEEVGPVAYQEIVATVGAGIDFMMRDDMAFVFEGSYFETRDVANAPGPWTGWTGGLAMKYYWY